MKDLRLQLMSGVDIPVPECQLTVHQPRIKEIALIGEHKFFIGAQTLYVNKNMVMQDETHLPDISNFQIFMMIMAEKKASDKKEAVLDLFQLLFPNYKVSILPPRSIIFSFEGNTVVVDENNFEALQEILKAVFCFTSGPMDQSSFNPANKKAREIAEMIMRGRRIVAAQKGDAQTSIFTQYVSVLAIGLGSMSLQDCLNLTMFQLFDLVERYGLYINWDLNIKSRLAGGKPDEQPENWMKNIH